MLKLYQLHSVNSKDFGAVLIFETIYFDRPLVCSAKDSVKDGHAGSRRGLKLERVGPTFSRFNLPAKITKQFIMVQCALMKFVWYIFLQLYRSISCMENPGGGGGYSTNVYTGRLRLEVQPLIWCFPMVNNAWAPFDISFFTKKVPLSYKTTCRRFPPSTKPWRDKLVRAKLANIDNTSKAPCQHIPWVATPDMAASPHFQQHRRNKTN